MAGYRENFYYPELELEAAVHTSGVKCSFYGQATEMPVDHWDLTSASREIAVLHFNQSCKERMAIT